MTENVLQKNIDAFNRIKDELENENFGRTALMHDGNLNSIFNDKFDAYAVGCDQFGIGKFAIQTFGETPISLGIHTLCLHN